MKYVTTLGAYGLAAAAAFAVALAVLVSVSTTQTAEAATIDFAADDPDNAVIAAPGDTVNVAVDSAFATVSITSTAEGVGASFVAGGGQSVSCSDDSSCDVDDSSADAGRQNVAGEVSVALKIDEDSDEGHILLSVGGLGTAAVSKVITVSKANLVGSLTIKAAQKTIAAADGETTLTVEVKNAAGTPAGLNDQDVSLITTLGSIECVAGTETQACSVETADATVDSDTVPGRATITLNGKGVEGEAVVTARLGSLTATATVTLFGTAKNLTAEPDQGSIEIGGSVYVVLTVTDGAGNPVSGQIIEPLESKEVVGPGDDPVLVVTEKNTPLDGDSPVGRGYSQDKPAAGSAAAIPACGDDNTDTDADDGGLQELFGPNDGTGDAGEGTNDKGQCVVHVTAPEDTADADNNATRGAHTLNFEISATVKASAVIEVAGKPASISTDAPDRVDPASVTEITVSVFDDEDVLVGITEVTVRKVGGDGLIEDQGEGNLEMTSDGQSKFTFIAPSAEGSSEILITAGDRNHRVTLTIGLPDDDCPDGSSVPAGEPCAPVECPDGTSVANGESCPDVECPDGTSVGNGESCPDVECPDGTSVANGETCPEPEAPEAATLTVQGNLGSFSGGSLDDFAAAANAACPGGSQIAVQDAGGAWQLWSSTAPAFVNIGFTTAFADGFDGATLVWVTSCEADAMESEGSMEEGSMAEGSMEENGG